MITPAGYQVNRELLSQALSLIKTDEFKTTINQASGDFFYNPWEMNSVYKGTVFEELLNSLNFPIGEARIIVLKPGTCYLSHADIDDRYHLNLSGENCYLVNLETSTMYPQVSDGIWYSMDAGQRHSAVNFGNVDRVQLVVRKLLNNNDIGDYVSVTIKPIGEKPRYDFDDEISPWLNRMNKENALSKFAVLADGVQFQLSASRVIDLDSFSKNKFLIRVL